MSKARRYSGCLVAIVLMSSPAYAAEWTFTSRLSQRFQFDTNRELDSNNSDGGNVFESRSGIDLTADGATERTDWTLSTGVSGSFYAGEGVDDEIEVGADPRVSGSMRHQVNDSSTVGANFDFSIRPTSTSQIDDTGVTDQDVDQYTYGAGADYTYQVNEVNDLSVSVQGSMTEFSKDTADLEPTTAVEVQGAWNHDFTARTSGGLILGVGSFWVDDAENTESQFAGLAARLEHALTENLTAQGQAGATLVHTERTIAGSDDRDIRGGFAGEAELVYRGESLETSIRAAHGLEPSSGGELQTVTEVEFNFAHAINDSSSVLFSSAYRMQESAGGFEANNTDRQTISVSPAYELGLTEAWLLRVGYDYRFTHDTTETENNHSVFLQVSRDFTIFP